MDTLDFILVAVFSFGWFLVGVGHGAENVRTEAVDNGSAYFCIVDHEKVFSWEPCDD